MEYNLIKNQEELNYHLDKIKNCKYFAVDTEFMRRNTFFPQLSLLQICYRENFAIIVDCLSGIDISELIDLIYDKNIIKIFHSSRQDLEILYYRKLSLPENIFDTQLAVMLLGFDSNVSYEKIVKNFLNIQLDKTPKKSNWIKRPLSEKQLLYASYDVIYLYEVYAIIIDLLQKRNRVHWIKDICLELSNTSIYENKTIKDVYKLSNDSSIKNLSLLNNLLEWREKIAKKLDVPRNTFLHFTLIKKIVALNEFNNNKIKSLIKNNLEEVYIDEIINIINTTSSKQLVIKTIELTQLQKELLSLIKIIINHFSIKNNLHQSIIASNEELIDFSINLEKSVARFMKDWRFEVFGKLLLQFIEGKKFLRIENDNIFIDDSS